MRNSDFLFDSGRKKRYVVQNDESSALSPKPPPIRPIRKSLTAEEQKIVDQCAQEKYHIPISILMEHAGLAVAAASEIVAGSKGSPVHIFTGHGNNAGDAYVAARHLFARGYEVTLWECFDESAYSPLVEQVRKSAMSFGIQAYPARTFEPAAFIGGISRMFNQRTIGIPVPCVFVDGILGSGFTAERDLPKELLHVTRKIQEGRNGGARVVAIDIPTGVDATTGETVDGAVQADCTVSFLLPKVGILSGNGKLLAGQIRIDTLGLPRYFADLALKPE